jgi:hypothetical protein
MVSLMGIYGITRKLNGMVANAPYVWTHATAGTLHGDAWYPGPFRLAEMAGSPEQNIGKGVFPCLPWRRIHSPHQLSRRLSPACHRVA